MHDHWSLFKSYPLKKNVFFSGKYVLKLENHLEWKSNDCITIVGINKSSEQMIYYDSYQVLKLAKSFNFTN